MNKGAEAILKSIVGDAGIETLSKAIFRRQTESVADPMELYLPLMVVPRAILSWLVQNIQPLKVGEHRDMEIPGQDGVIFHVEKQASDVYRGEIVREGRVIHSFDKQSLPSIGGHLMTVFERYDHLKEDEKPKVDKDKEIGEEYARRMDEAAEGIEAQERQLQEREALAHSVASRLKEMGDSSGIVRTIMNMNGISVESNEPGAVSAMVQLASIRSLTESIGQLVDALVMRRTSEAMGKEEIKADDGKVKESHMPKQAKSKDIIAEGQSLDEVRREAVEMDADEQAKIMSKDYDPKVMKEGEQAADASPKKESISKEEKPASKPSQRGLRSLIPNGRTYKQNKAAAQASVDRKLGRAPDPKAALEAAVAAVQKPPVKKDDGMGPVTGSSLMSSASPSTGMAKAGLEVKPAKQPNAVPVGAGGVKPGLKQPKGQMGIPVIKEELDKAIAGPQKPGGAGMPKMPAAAQMPKGPTGPSNNPGAAQKQTQVSAAGGQTKPAAGSVNKPMPKNPAQQTMKPKMSAMKAEVSGYSPSNPPGKQIPKILDRPASHPGKRSLRNLIRNDKPAQAMGKSETLVSESELYQKCEHCGRSEFTRASDGPVFSPCACFVALTKDDEGKPMNFVALRKTDAGYKIAFDPKADEDAVKAFLLLMKSKILIKKRFGV